MEQESELAHSRARSISVMASASSSGLMAMALRALLDWSWSLEVLGEKEEAEENAGLWMTTEERENAETEPVVRRAIVSEAWILVTIVECDEMN